MVFENLIRDVNEIQSQLGPTDESSLVFKKWDEFTQVYIDSFEIISQNIGHAFTVGHPVNGIVGTANGVDGLQITIGTGGLGSSSVIYSS